MEQPLDFWEEGLADILVDNVEEASITNGISISELNATSIANGSIDYTADSDFCLEDFFDFSGAAGSQDVSSKGSGERSSRRPQRSQTVPAFGQADDEMVLPPYLQPVMTTRVAHEPTVPAFHGNHGGDSLNVAVPVGLTHEMGDAPLEQGDAYQLDLNDVATRALYDKLLLFSHQHTVDDCLIFEDCDRIKELTLRNLASTIFKLDFTIETITRRVSISRASAASACSSSERSEGQQQQLGKTSRPTTGDSVVGPTGPRPDGADTSCVLPRSSSEFSLPLRTVSPDAQTRSLEPAVHDTPNTRPSSSSTKGAAIHSNPSPDILLPPICPSGGCQPLSSTLGIDNRAAHSHGVGQAIVRRASSTAAHGRLRQPQTAYASRSIKTAVRQRLHTWTSKTIDKCSGHLGVLHEEAYDPRAAKRRALYSKSLEDLGGPCWRCMILGLNCDAEESCRECPALSLEENAPLWPLVGCRRGPLSRAMPPPILCPGARKAQKRRRSPSPNTRRAAIASLHERDTAAEFLRHAEGQRLQDTKAILGDVSLDADSDALDTSATSIFVDIVKNRHYRDNISLNRRYWSQGKSFTYAELITTISWELMDNTSTVADLEIEAVDNFIQLLEVASSCEGDFCSTWLVFLSLICLKDCLDALRLIYSGLLTPESHKTCSGEECDVICLRDLWIHVADYVDELSRVLFKSERRDKHCWLSIFFSLYIQSYVRHALLVIEKRLVSIEHDDSPPASHNATNYLHLAATLFGAASAQFDPVFPGQPAGFRNESPVHEHLEGYVSYARSVCLVEASFFEGAVATSFEFLRRLLQIGAPDFDQEDDEQSTGLLDGWNIGDEAMDLAPSAEQSQTLRVNSICLSNEQSSVMEDFARQEPSAHSLEYGYAPSTLNSATSSESLLTSLFSFEVQSPLAASFRDYASTCSISIESSQGLRTSMQAVRPYMQLPAPSYAARPLPEPPVQRSVSPAGGVEDSTLICDCCPKRPQAFDTAEELRAHTQKKPHVCEICGTRTKNKNEAKRHYNAVHLRPFSWSCQKLGTPLSAFQVHRQASQPTLCYTCGFCGRMFHREATAPLMVGERLGELDAHVRTEHKFGMCSNEKKFFRDDHFSQHLKTVHGAVTGEWLKGLVEICKSGES